MKRSKTETDENGRLGGDHFHYRKGYTWNIGKEDGSNERELYKSRFKTYSGSPD